MPRHNAKGRSARERFVGLPHYLLSAPAWRSLSPVARCTFIELAALYNGANNGRLALSARDAAERVGCSKNTAGRAFRELIERGFVEQARRGTFHRKTRHAGEYRITLWPCDQSGALPSKAFMRWQSLPKKNTVSPEGQTVSPEGQLVSSRKKVASFVPLMTP